MGLLLLIVATILKLIFGAFSYIYGTFASLKRGGVKEWNEWNLTLALAKDQYGNVLLKYPLNDWARKDNGYKFGNPDETISSVLGKNYVGNTLTKFGIIISKILNRLDPNHVQKSVDKTEDDAGLRKIKPQ